MSVGLVVVSHSAKIADGVIELAGQMATDVAMAAAGGTDDGGIGTSVAKIQSGIEAVESGDGVVVLTDLGSAVMSAEMVVEMLDPALAPGVQIADAPLVEGAVAAAVAAAGGQSVDEVARAAEGAAGLMAAGKIGEPPNSDPGSGTGSVSGPDSPGGQATAASGEGSAGGPAGTGSGIDGAGGGTVTGTWTLPNEMGLHARPAAEVAKKIQDLDVEAEINGVDAASVMLLMTLGLKKGQELTLTATGPEAQAAKEWLARQVENGFGEL
ncbi:dihydroxyacetone kinase phosphoryl donor subunit DhaM [Haematomicrobium sanguinis]|uniref:dihydroxyacetone kinase phosphoryl donor subunit DhaM n=1 Tax=Haematomicrobium sanguinis TaxID=479106 RepID=UPI0004793537|nr:dihydroxyacetone kinase phosphoryl donor subunit DhaM [Haematomicrobium sanguinis]